jgi:CubicO group peptidase (beta-lactamase class C family)
MKLFNHPSTFLFFVLLLTSINLKANNGAIAYIYPISNITIDGNLDDWPASVQLNKMEHIHYGAGLDNPEDGSASWRGGYDAKNGYIYIGVTMLDNDYVKTPNNSHYTSHDFQVIYLDLIHSPEGAGVIAYEVDEDHRKIVEQSGLSFYPQVKNASFDAVELAIKKNKKTITYEWKIKVPMPLTPGRVIGFDYGIFDKDKDEDHVMLTWGNTGGDKFRNSNLIGDLVLMDKKTSFSEVDGSLKWEGPTQGQWPNTVRLSSSNNPNIFFNASIDSLGKYNLELPKGEYNISVAPTWRMTDWPNIELVKGINPATKVTINENKTLIDPVGIKLVPKPKLISEKGLLQSPFTAKSKEKVDKFVEAYQAHYNVPGVSLALIQDGKLVYHQTYGVENNISQNTLRKEAVFEAASITKLVFAYAMNRLVQRGEFDLDKPLYETLPFPELEEYPEYKLMTGRHVLTHVSGLPNWGARMINKPGTTYGYSGEGFEYLKKVVAKGDFDNLPNIIQALLEKEILNPLGMQNTYFMCGDQLSKRKVAGHFDGIPSMDDCPDVPGMAYSMHTEAKDFTSFAIALLNREGLTEEQAKKMFSFHTLNDEEDWIDGYKSGFGLGVYLRESPYGLVFGHGGNNGDFRCTFEMYDELKTGYIMFTNANTAEPLLFDLSKFLVEGKK